MRFHSNAMVFIIELSTANLTMSYARLRILHNLFMLRFLSFFPYAIRRRS